MIAKIEGKGQVGFAGFVVEGAGSVLVPGVFPDLDRLDDVPEEHQLNRGGLVHHSDRGPQYVSIKCTERLAEAGIELSVGSVGDSYDNPVLSLSKRLWLRRSTDCTKPR